MKFGYTTSSVVRDIDGKIKSVSNIYNERLSVGDKVKAGSMNQTKIVGKVVEIKKTGDQFYEAHILVEDKQRLGLLCYLTLYKKFGLNKIEGELVVELL